MSYTPNQIAEKTGFVTTTPLSSGATFSSGVLISSGYSQVQTEIYADQDGTINIYFCSDAAGTDVVRTLTIPYVASTGYQFFSAPAFVNYIRYDYTNGSTGQSDFYYTTKFLSTSLSPQILRADGFISSSMVTQLNRSLLVGRDYSGNFRNVGVSEDGHLYVHIDEPTTAFGDLRTAEMTPLLQITHPYELNLDLIKTTTTGSGTVSHDGTNRMVQIGSGAASSSSGIMESRRLVKYRNGQGMVTRWTSIYGTGTTGNTQYCGWGDAADGFFFGYNGTTFGILQRNSSSGNIFVTQSSWNLDKMDGSSSTTNPSGQLLDPLKGNVYQVQAQWLGFGAITFYLEDKETGRFVPVHRVKYANTNIIPSVINPTFPIRFESINTTNNTNIQIKTASMAAFNEGMLRFTGPTKSFQNAKASGTNTVQFTLFNPTTYKSKSNRSRIKITNMHMYSDQANADPVRFALHVNATLSGATYSSVGNYTAIQSDTTATLSAAGTVIYQSGVSEVDSAAYNLSEYDIFLNPGDTISVVSNGINSGAGVSLTWIEDI